jgi:hypothetical protein
MRRWVPIGIAASLAITGSLHAQDARDPFRAFGVATPQEPSPTGRVPARPQAFARLAEDLRETRAIVLDVAGLPIDSRKALDVVTAGEPVAERGQPFGGDEKSKGLPSRRFVLAFLNIDGGVIVFEQAGVDPPLRVAAYVLSELEPMTICVYAYRTAVGDIVELPPSANSPEFANWSEKDPQPLVVSVTEALMTRAPPLECREVAPRGP